jgi:cytochrome o ubiquinol oxidase operon protein cyoD
MKQLLIYTSGFVASIALTAVAFGLNEIHERSGHVFPTHELLVPILIALALAQLLVQLVCFLHLGQEAKPRWNLFALAFAVLIVTIVVGGTLWIMHNLAQGHTSAMEVMTGENIFPTGQ